MTGPLQRFQVVELAEGIAAPYAGKLLADFGADVIKVEPPGGDQLRHCPPFAHDAPGIEHSGAFYYCNTNKRGITLNLDDPAARDILTRLTGTADVFIDGTPYGWLEAHDLAVDTLRERNPALVVLTLSAFGRYGEYRARQGDEMIISHSSGLGYIGRPRDFAAQQQDRPPLKAGGNQASFFSGLAGALGVLLALFERRRTGTGVVVDLSMQDAAISTLGPAFASYSYLGHVVGKEAAFQPSAPINLVRCRDGYVWLQCSEELHWRNFVAMMGNPDWAELEIFEDRFTRGKHWDALEPLILEWTMQHDKEEIYRLAQSKRVPHAPAYTFEELIKNAQLLARGFFAAHEHPVAGTVAVPGAPFQMQQTPWRAGRPPLLGEHSAEVLSSLGFSRDEQAALAAGGVL